MVLSSTPTDRRFHSVSRRFTQAHLEVSGFIVLGTDSLWRSQWSSGSLGFGRVHSFACKSFRAQLGSRGFNQARLMVVLFIQVPVGSLRRDRGQPDHLGSRRLTGASLMVVGFIRVCVGSLSATRCGRVHLGSRWLTEARMGVFEFIRVWAGSLWNTQLSSRSFCFALVHSGATRLCRIHSGSHGFNRARQGVIGLIRFRMDLLLRTYVSLGSFVLAWVHSGAICVLSGSFRFDKICVVGFIWVHSALPSDRGVHSVSSWFATARPEVVGIIPVCVRSLWRTKWLSG